MKKYIKTNIINDFESLSNVAQVFLTTVDFRELVQKVVDSVLLEVSKLGHDFHIAVLALIKEQKDGYSVLKRISFSSTNTAYQVEKKLSKKTPFKNIITPLEAKQNYCIKVLEKRQHLITHSYVDILHPPISKEVCNKMQKAGNIQTSAVFPIIVRDKAIGTIIFSTKRHIKELTDREVAFVASLSGIIGIAVENANLFEQVEKDKKALKKANEKLIKLDQLKDEFVSIASHELRTPMTAIKNYLWMAINRPKKPLATDVKKNIKIAYGSTERLIHLVNDMLTISRIEGHRIELKKDIFDLREVAQATFDELTPIADTKNIKFIFERAEKSMCVEGDKDKLREIIQNLVGNALKFTPEKGKVTIIGETNKTHVYLRVKDTGPGIPSKDLNRLFTKFTKLNHSYKKIKETGTGLGLYISKEIAELHKGDIKVKSIVNKGTTFSLMLPKAKPKAESQNTAAQEHKMNLDETKTVST